MNLAGAEKTAARVQCRRSGLAPITIKPVRPKATPDELAIV
jgi:hypothetical protein